MTDISSAARAVLTAVTLKKYDVPPEGLPDFAEEMAPLIAAALRAAAHEVAPFPGRYPMNEYMEGFREAKQSVHHQLLAIAAELEGAP
jgi:hypothetical protein